MKSFRTLFSFLALTGVLVATDIAVVGANPVPSIHNELHETDYYPYRRPYYYGGWYPREVALRTKTSDETESSDLETRGSDLFPFDFGYDYRHGYRNRDRVGGFFPREVEVEMSSEDDAAAEAPDSKLLPPFGYYRHHRIHHRPGVYYRREVAAEGDTSDEGDIAAYFPNHYGSHHRHHLYRPYNWYLREDAKIQENA